MSEALAIKSILTLLQAPIPLLMPLSLKLKPCRYPRTKLAETHSYSETISKQASKIFICSRCFWFAISEACGGIFFNAFQLSYVTKERSKCVTFTSKTRLSAVWSISSVQQSRVELALIPCVMSSEIIRLSS